MKYIYVLDHDAGGVCKQFRLTPTQQKLMKDEDSQEKVLEQLEDKHNINIQNQEWMESDYGLETI